MQARGDLRHVQLELRRDVEDTGRLLMVLNVIAWPLLVAALATTWSMARAIGSRRPLETGARPA